MKVSNGKSMNYILVSVFKRGDTEDGQRKKKKFQSFWQRYLKEDKRETATAPQSYRIFLRRRGTPIQEAPLRIFRTFICIKRIPPAPFLCCFPRSLYLFLSPTAVCLPDARFLPIRYLKAFPLFRSSPSIFSAQHRVFKFRFYISFEPFFIVTSNPSRLPLFFSPHTAYLLFVFF